MSSYIQFNIHMHSPRYTGMLLYFYNIYYTFKFRKSELIIEETENSRILLTHEMQCLYPSDSKNALKLTCKGVRSTK